ncbi:hypothetical protein ACWDMY_31200, partial [Streptomyces globisporus]
VVGTARHGHPGRGLERAAPRGARRLLPDDVRVLDRRSTQAKHNGELLPHVNPTETADLYVAAFTGTQAVSQTLTNYRDLQRRHITLQQHILPSIAAPSILTALDLTPARAERLSRLAPED